MGEPLASVIIPAHNEGETLGRCLTALLADATGDEFEVVVVANGCTDRTADVARAFGVRVVETSAVGKAPALRLGDDAATVFPRIYLDADIELGTASARALVAALGVGGLMASAPTASFDLAAVSRPARRVHGVHEALMADRRGLAGAGAYALSSDGHARVAPIPDVIADDAYVHRCFAPAERAAVANAYAVIRPPRTLIGNVRRRLRIRAGNRQLAQRGYPDDSGPGVRDLVRLVAARAVSLTDAEMYLAVAGAERAWGGVRRVMRTGTRWDGNRLSPRQPRLGADGPAGPTDDIRRRPHVLVLVQNLSVPIDRRVWTECVELSGRGYRVSVICPRFSGEPDRERREGIDIYRYRPGATASRPPDYLTEFGYRWVRTVLLSLVVWRQERFDVIQACNPPDTFWLLARLWRVRGVRFVFDQHDLCPELFRSKFGEPETLAARMQWRGLLWLERRTYRAADRVIVPNESYQRAAVLRGGRPPSEVAVVRSGPNTLRMRPVYPPAGLRPATGHLLVWLGVMGPQDGVDLVVASMEILVHQRGRHDVTAVLLGFGERLSELKSRSHLLGLDDVVRFTGLADAATVADYLSAGDIGLCTDPKTPFSDVSTMNKIMEYMAYGLPSVAFDLFENRVSGGDCVLYAPSGDLNAFCDAVETLLDNPGLRQDMGVRARARASGPLRWDIQAERYAGVYRSLIGPGVDSAADERPVTDAPADRRYVPLEDEAELRRFIAERSEPVR